MNSITPGSYFNPLSDKHDAIDKFKKLDGWTKAGIIFVTAVVTPFTLGFGGVAVFRALTYKFSAKPIEHASGAVQAMAAKTNVYMFELGRAVASKGMKLIDDTGYDSLETEKDTLFKIFGEAFGKTPEEIQKELKTYIERNSAYVEAAFKKAFPKNRRDLPFDLFKQYLIDGNLPKSLEKKYGADKLMLLTSLQEFVNHVRCDLLAQAFNAKVVLHQANVNHAKDMIFVSAHIYPTISEDKHIGTRVEDAPTSYGKEDAKPVIELVSGSMISAGFMTPNNQVVFIQPRKLEKA